MKKLLLLLTFVLFSFFSQAQTYFVLHVKGDIKVKGNEHALKVGDKIDAKSELQFLSQDATAMVMSRETGRMRLDGNKTEANETGEFIAFLENVILPVKSNMQMSTRGGEAKSVIDFQEYFGTERFAIIGDELVVNVNEGKFPITNSQVFIYRYETKLEVKPVINKVVQSKGNQLIFNKEQLYTSKSGNSSSKEIMIDPESIENVQLFYFNKKNRDTRQLVAFHPVFIKEKSLEKELKTLTKFLTEHEVVSNEALQQELLNFVFDVYGKTHDVAFQNWVEKKGILPEKKDKNKDENKDKHNDEDKDNDND